MSPLEAEDELRRSIRNKQIDQYQKYIESLDDAKGSKNESASGKLNGKEIKKISSTDTNESKISDKFIQISNDKKLDS